MSILLPMPRWVVAVSASARGCDPTGDAVAATEENHGKDAGVGCLVVSVVAPETKTIAWHMVSTAETWDTEAAVSHVRVLLEAIQWQDNAPRAAEITVVAVEDSEPQWRACVEAFARARGFNVSTPTRGLTDDRDLQNESVQALLSPAAHSAYNAAQHTTEERVFACCVHATFVATMAQGGIQGSSRLDHAFHLTVEVYSTPLRPHLRLDHLAQKMWIQSSARHTSPSIIGILRPLCRTKNGKQALQQRLEKPEVDIKLVRTRHDHLDELIAALTRSSKVGSAIVDLLECAIDAEANHTWFLESVRQRDRVSIPRPGLQDIRAFCDWVRSLSSKCESLQVILEAAGARLLCGAYLSRLSSTISLITASFIGETEHHLDGFLTGKDSDTNNRVSTITKLRQQIAECETAIQEHRDEAATELLLPPERIKVIFEEDDFTASRSTTPSVVFRVTRQDGHRVFRASAESNDQSYNCRVTLVHSRRTTGVWFSTQRLDALAAQRRALHLDLIRLEDQLSSSLVHQYDLHARRPVCECVAVITDLDVLSAFAQLSTRQNFTRPIILEEPHALDVEGLRWPWNETAIAAGSRPSPKRARRDAESDGCQCSIRLGRDHCMLAIHSAVDNDVTILSRLALVVVLNQAGCFVPCRKAILPIFDSLFFRTGAVDDTLANKSTFLTEMHQVSTILDRATSKSLVLIDELCRGTAPGEGLPLAVAICEHLVEERLFSCIATQWTELFDALLVVDHVTVPANFGGDAASVNRLKRIYSERLKACDERFIARLHELEFPSELADDIAQDLAVPPGNH